jgi:hypothetical protein
MNSKPGKPGGAGFVLAHIVCCGGILLFATGALTGFGAWLVGSGLPWVALASLLGVGLVILWRRQRGRPAQCNLDETGRAGEVGDIGRNRRNARGREI